MRLFVVLGALVLMFSLPAHAQSGQMVGGAAVGSSALNNMNALPSMVFPSPRPLPTTRFLMRVMNGTNEDFVPSSFMNFDEAVAKGVADLAAKPKSIVEVAQENRAEQHAKAQVNFVQDANGHPIKATD